MSSPRMHADEFSIGVDLVRALVDEAAPRWRALPLTRLEHAGTAHAIFRLGEERLVRLPRAPSSALQVEKEHRFLDRLAPSLPLEIPRPLHRGAPTARFAWPWSVYPWIEGEDAATAELDDPIASARRLAAFVRALSAIDAADAPPPGEHNFGRGVPLATRDQAVRGALAELDAWGDAWRHGDLARREWERALAAPLHDGPPVWIHGDLTPRNLIVRAGDLAAVLDFGGLGAGDPACDLLAAWTLFDRDARAAFRDALEVDDATWARGRGWAVSCALMALPYYRDTNPVLVAESMRALRALSEGD